jgi:transposase
VAISNDLRIRVVEKVASGVSCRRAAAHFEVSPSSAIRFVQRYEDEGTVAVKQPPPRKRRLDPYGEHILHCIEQTPDMTLQELSDHLGEVHGVRAPVSTVDDWLRAKKISWKKNRARQ